MKYICVKKIDGFTVGKTYEIIEVISSLSGVTWDPGTVYSTFNDDDQLWFINNNSQNKILWSCFKLLNKVRKGKLERII